ncbi:DNA polymerase III subunit delta [Endothiovibrio diazotrophicus]
MRLKPEQLASHLRSGAAPIYLVSGDEPLQVAECCDAIRVRARAEGAEEREVFHAETGFDWNALTHAAGSLSLFASKRLMELRIPSGKPGKEGGKALQEYAARPPEDVLLLITLPRLDAAAQKAAWVKALEGAGVLIQVWPVEPRQLPGWIAHRMRGKGLSADEEAVALLAERVEGNLLAAAQEIDKLFLLHGEGRVGAAEVAESVADSARFDSFGLVDCLLEGNAARAMRMIGGLRAEGEDALHLLGTLVWALRGLAEISAETRSGRSLDAALERRYAWKKRKGLIQRGLRRLGGNRLHALLRHAARIDRVCKGMAPGDGWEELTHLSLAIAGVSPLGGQRIVPGR